MSNINRQKRPRSSPASPERMAHPPAMKKYKEGGISSLGELLKETVQNIEKKYTNNALPQSNNIDYLFKIKGYTDLNNIVSIPENFPGTKQWFSQAGVDLTYKIKIKEPIKVDSIIRLALAYKLQQNPLSRNKKIETDDLKNNECDLVMIKNMEVIIKDFQGYNIIIENNFGSQLEILKTELVSKKSLSFLDAIGLVGNLSFSERLSCKKMKNPVENDLTPERFKKLASNSSAGKSGKKELKALKEISLSSESILESEAQSQNVEEAITSLHSSVGEYSNIENFSEETLFTDNISNEDLVKNLTPFISQQNIFINVHPPTQTTYVPEYYNVAGTSNNPEQFTPSQDETEFYEWLNINFLSKQN